MVLLVMTAGFLKETAINLGISGKLEPKTRAKDTCREGCLMLVIMIIILKLLCSAVVFATQSSMCIPRISQKTVILLELSQQVMAFQVDVFI